MPSAVAVGSTKTRPHWLPRSRAGGLWVTPVAFALVLLLPLIFILQNGQRSDIYYFGAHGQLSTSVALLIAAIFGILFVALPTAVRIPQLRLMAARHGTWTATRTPAGVQKPAGSR